MSVLENFKNIPRSPYGATGLKCIFFSSNLQRSPWRKKRGGLSPPQRATGSCRPLGGATGSLLPILNPGHHSPSFPLSFEPKNSETKERGEEKKSGEALSNYVLLIYM